MLNKIKHFIRKTNRIEDGLTDELKSYIKMERLAATLSGMMISMVILILVLFGDSIFGLANGRVALGSILLKVEKIEKIIQAKYVDYDTLDDDKNIYSPDIISDAICSGYVDRLNDQYSKYLTKAEVRDLTDSVNGSFVGIGVTIAKDRDTGNIIITYVNDGGPAEKAGIKKGDVIYSIGNTVIKGMSIIDTSSLLRGEKGTTLNIKIVRDGNVKELNIIRDDIVRKTVSADVIDNNIGYVQIYQFDEKTPEQFNTEYNKIKNKNIKGLIIDLRGNPGGTVQSAVSICEHFKHNSLISYMLDKKGNRTEFKTGDSEELIKLPTVLLVDKNTASAAEIVTAAFKELKLGKVVGTNTFGKGIVQTIFDLGDGSALELTIAKYYTPSNNNIQFKGIKPDIEIEYDYSKYISDETDTQLEKAKSILK